MPFLLLAAGLFLLVVSGLEAGGGWHLAWRLAALGAASVLIPMLTG